MTLFYQHKQLAGCDINHSEITRDGRQQTLLGRSFRESCEILQMRQGNRIRIFVEVKTYRYLKCAGSNTPCNRARLQSCRKLSSELEGFSPCKRPFQARTYFCGPTATPEDCSTEGLPQGLKANLFNDLIGTTEVVPCYIAFSGGSKTGISHFGLFFKCDCPCRRTWVPKPKGRKSKISF
jgi:hypothetical protein